MVRKRAPQVARTTGVPKCVAQDGTSGDWCVCGRPVPQVKGTVATRFTLCRKHSQMAVSMMHRRIL